MPSRLRPRALIVLLGLLVGTAEGRAWAQSPTEIAAARERFAEGLAREQAGNFAEAVQSFRAAATIKQTPQILYHQGTCEKELGQLVEALVSLERAVDLARQARVAEVEAAAKSMADTVRARIARLDVAIEGGAEPTRATLDGVTIAVATLHAPMAVNPGEHELVLAFATGEVRQKVTALEGKTASVALTPPPKPIEPAPPSPPPSTEPAAPESTAPPPPSPSGASVPAAPAESSSIAPWVVVGGGAAALITGGVLFALGQGTRSDLESACPSKTGCDPALESDYDSGRLEHTVGLVLGGVGLAAAGVGAYLLLRPSANSSVQPSVHASARGAVLRVRF